MKQFEGVFTPPDA